MLRQISGHSENDNDRRRLVLTEEYAPWVVNSSSSSSITNNTVDSSEIRHPDPWDELYAVLIPNHVQPGQEFLVLFLQSYILKLKCPTTERGGGDMTAGSTGEGQTLLFLPPKRTTFACTSLSQDKTEEMKHKRLLHLRQRQVATPSEDLNTRLPKNTISKVVQARFYTSPNIQRIRNVTKLPSGIITPLTNDQHDYGPDKEEQSILSTTSSSTSKGTSVGIVSTLMFAVTVPSYIPHDTILHVTILGQALQIHCPPTKKPGEKIYLEIPNPFESSTSSSLSSRTLGSSPYCDVNKSMSSNKSILTDNDTSTAALQVSVIDDGCGGSSSSGNKASNMSRTVENEDLEEDDEEEEKSTAETSVHNPSVSDTDTTSYHVIHPEHSVVPSTVVSNDDPLQTVVESPDLDHVITEDTSTERGPGETRTISSSSSIAESDPDSSTQIFDVIIPEGIQPGGNFPFIVAENIRVFITCPLNAHPGERVRFNLPLSRLSGITDTSPMNRLFHSQSVDEIKMIYKGSRWMRPLRLSDMKFIWLPIDQDDCLLQSAHRFDIQRSAFVRKLDVRNEMSLSTHLSNIISFIPASEASMRSNICFGDDEREIFSARDIAMATDFNFQDKVAWFRRACSILRVDFFRGHVKIQIRRSFLLQDSINAVMSLDRHDLRKVWRFSFIDEDAIDAGGVSREWFESVSKAMFDPGFGLWTSTTSKQNKMQINASSGQCHENDLFLFRFLGRVMGKALFDHHLVSTHMIEAMYKNILGWPLTFSDLESIDEEYYRHLKSLTSLNVEQLSDMGLDFTTVNENLTMKTVIDLIPNGALHNVTTDNLPEYLAACWMHKMVDRFKSQLCAFLLGFYDVIPEPLVTVFDYQELELVMCGVPVIDIFDWRYNTVYSGLCKDEGYDHMISRWFWELVDDMEQEMRARLLQFVTGCSGVPVGGFSLLQGNDGNIRSFTIHVVDESSSYYPRSQYVVISHDTMIFVP